MVQHAIVVCLAVGLHSGDAVVKPVAYENRWYKDRDCPGQTDWTHRYDLESCRTSKCGTHDQFDRYQLDRQINDTHLFIGAGCSGDGYTAAGCDETAYMWEGAEVAVGCVNYPMSGSGGFFWASSPSPPHMKDLVV